MPIETQIAEAIEKHLPAVRQLVTDTIGNMSHEVRTTGPTAEVDAGLFGKLKEYCHVKEQLQTSRQKPLQEVTRGIFHDPALAAEDSAQKRNLSQIHNSLVAKQHPLKEHTGVLLQQDPNNAKRTLSQLALHVPMQAARDAELQVLGANHEHITPLFYDLYAMKDPTARTHADAMANMFSSVTKDRAELVGTFSRTKFDISEYTRTVNKFKIGDARVPLPSDLKATSTQVKEYERAAHKLTSTICAPWMAIPHIGTLFNLSSVPAHLIAKGLLSTSDSALRTTIEHTGVLASTMHAIMAQDIDARTGIGASVIGHKAASILSRGIHNPGFHQIRLRQLMFGGAVGHHATIEWAANAAKGDRRAIAEITRMGLDHKAIIKREGVLTDDELQRGIFNFVNDRFFISKSYERSLHSNSNFFMRSATMFHAFVGYQANFMAGELKHLAKSGDFVSLAQYVASVGILFPAVAPMLKSAEALVRTGSFKEAKEGLENDYSILAKPAFSKAYLAEYLSLVSYIGAWGMYDRLLHAAESHKFEKAMGGPLFGDTFSVAEDVASPALKYLQGKKADVTPLERDALRYGVPVAGSALTHQLLPNKPKNHNFRRRLR